MHGEARAYAADVLPALRVAACNDYAAPVLALLGMLGTRAAGVDDQTGFFLRNDAR